MQTQSKEILSNLQEIVDNLEIKEGDYLKISKHLKNLNDLNEGNYFNQNDDDEEEEEINLEEYLY